MNEAQKVAQRALNLTGRLCGHAAAGDSVVVGDVIAVGLGDEPGEIDHATVTKLISHQEYLDWVEEAKSVDPDRPLSHEQLDETRTFYEFIVD